MCLTPMSGRQRGRMGVQWGEGTERERGWKKRGKSMRKRQEEEERNETADAVRIFGKERGKK